MYVWPVVYASQSMCEGCRWCSVRKGKRTSEKVLMRKKTKTTTATSHNNINQKKKRNKKIFKKYG
jgi:hypothetical protein